MATIYRRGKTWWGRFTYKKIESRTTLETASRTVAEKRLVKWVKEKKAETWGDGAGKTFDDAMISFLETHVPTLRPNSQRRYETSAKHLTEFFSGFSLSGITSAKMAEYENRRRKNGHEAPNDPL